MVSDEMRAMITGNSLERVRGPDEFPLPVLLLTSLHPIGMAIRVQQPTRRIPRVAANTRRANYLDLILLMYAYYLDLILLMCVDSLLRFHRELSTVVGE